MAYCLLLESIEVGCTSGVDLVNVLGLPGTVTLEVAEAVV